jgi:hypothetical protein
LVETFDPLPVTLQNFGRVSIPGVRLYRNLRAAPRAWFVRGGTLPDDPAAAYTPAAVAEYGPNGLVVQGDFPQSGLLVISQAWARGWSATDGSSGDPLPVRRAYGMFTAVEVAGGRQRVRLAYRPPGLRSGVVVSAFSLLIVGGLLLGGLLARRPPAKTAQRRPVEEESQQDQQQLVDEGQRVEAQQVQHQQEIDGDGQGKEER